MTAIPPSMCCGSSPTSLPSFLREASSSFSFSVSDSCLAAEAMARLTSAAHICPVLGVLANCGVIGKGGDTR
eukprot:1168563-Prorocentrum_minimum.AAC.2